MCASSPVLLPPWVGRMSSRPSIEGSARSQTAQQHRQALMDWPLPAPPPPPAVASHHQHQRRRALPQLQAARAHAACCLSCCQLLPWARRLLVLALLAVQQQRECCACRAALVPAAVAARQEQLAPLPRCASWTESGEVPPQAAPAARPHRLQAAPWQHGRGGRRCVLALPALAAAAPAQPHSPPPHQLLPPQARRPPQPLLLAPLRLAQRWQGRPDGRRRAPSVPAALAAAPPQLPPPQLPPPQLPPQQDPQPLLPPALQLQAPGWRVLL